MYLYHFSFVLLYLANIEILTMWWVWEKNINKQSNSRNTFSNKKNKEASKHTLTNRAEPWLLKDCTCYLSCDICGVVKPIDTQNTINDFSEYLISSYNPPSLQLQIREHIKEGFSYFLPMRVMRYLDMICGCTAATILVYFPPALIQDDRLVWTVRIGHQRTQWVSWTAPRSWSCCHIPHHQLLMVPNTYQVLSHTPQKACFPALFTIFTVKRV